MAENSSPLFLVPGAAIIFISLFSVFYWWKKKRVAFFFFLAGAVAWVVAALFKMVAALPRRAIIASLHQNFPSFIAEPASWLYFGLLTGIFECGILLIMIWLFTPLQHQSWEQAVGFGIGFGAFEALVIGTGSLLAGILVLAKTGTAQGANPIANPVLLPEPAIERALFIVIHAAAAVAIVFAWMRKDWKWFWLAFIYKTVVEAITAMLWLQFGSQSFTPALLYSVLVAFFMLAAAGLWLSLHLRTRWSGA